MFGSRSSSPWLLTTIQGRLQKETGMRSEIVEAFFAQLTSGRIRGCDEVASGWE